MIKQNNKSIDFNYNLSSYMEYDCDREYEGESKYSRIKNIKVQKEQNYYNIVNYISKNLQDIEKYFWERTIKIINDDKFETGKAEDYYGETTIIKFNWETQRQLEDIKNKTKDFTNIQLIHFLLNLEYGFILPTIKDFTKANVNTVNIENIYNPHMESYARKIKPYKEIDRNYPIGIYTKNNEQLQLIDGHHRYIHCLNNKIENVKVITIEK